MAAATREERALMRVRGAGSRKVPTINFGFNFAFGKKKEEQAQAPTPARSLRSNTKTPQYRRSASKQPSVTSLRRSREPSVARSATQEHPPTATSEDGPAMSEETHAEGSLRAAKRRRTTSNTVAPDPIPSTDAPTPSLSTRRSRRRTTSKAFTIAEDELVVEDNGPPPTSRLFVPQDDHQKENETPKDMSSKSPIRPLELQTTKSGRILLDPAAMPDETIVEDEDVLDPADEVSISFASTVPSLQAPRRLETPSQTKRRRRKSLALAKNRQKPSTPIDSETTTLETSPAGPSSRPLSEEPPALARLPLADRISRYSKLAKRKMMKAQAPVPERDQTPQDTEDDASYVETSPEPETPAVSKSTVKEDRPRAAKRRESSDISKNQNVKEGNQDKETFPILTHRLTNISRLPTIHEEGDEDTFNEDVCASISTEKRQPNVVDVLAQICRETIWNIIERIPDRGRAAEKATARNKRTALEAFGKDLDDELFAMSEAVENRINLEARTRKTKREKTALQSEYLELRKERERIALKCDAVRRQHWEYEEETRQKWTLSEAARRAEQEMERGEPEDDDGLEYLLRSVTASVSSASGQGGFLDRVKSFNNQLERMAHVLDSRGF